MQSVAVRLVVTAALAVTIAAASCARAIRTVEVTPGQPARIAELWQEPGNIAARDLFHGPGGAQLMPTQATFEFVAEDTTGYSPGFDVRDHRQMTWSVKTGPEAQSEVVASRVLWAIGFHQPPTYYVANWSLSGARAGAQEPGRFRPDLRGRTVTGEWPWHQNPFVGTREFGGLIVANLIVNSWDWKTSNNKIYQLDEPANGVDRWFVVRDLGASLGKFTYPTILTWFRLRGFGQGTRNDVADFEQQGFIKAVDRKRGRVEFDYRGIYRDVIASVTPPDVRWACERLSQVTDQQWRDVFRAGGYQDDVGARYTAKIKEKIAQGLRLTAGN
jgi:hypothetical protein